MTLYSATTRTNSSLAAAASLRKSAVRTGAGWTAGRRARPAAAAAAAVRARATPGAGAGRRRASRVPRWDGAGGDPPLPPSEVLQTLRELVRRLREPAPRRAAAPAAAADADEVEAASLRRLARQFVAGYAALPPLRRFGPPNDDDDESDGDGVNPRRDSCERFSVVDFLATDCGVDEAAVAAALEDYRSRRRGAASPDFCRRLRRAATPAHEAVTDLLLRHDPAATACLVRLREDLLPCLRHQRERPPPAPRGDEAAPARARERTRRLADLDAHLRSTFARLFAPGFLSHERLTYETTPAAVIEAVAVREAVHHYRSLDDLKARLGPSKRVYALFHPGLPGRPLAVVHAALIAAVPAAMADVMAPEGDDGEREPPASPTVAAFYSISNGVRGLTGVGLGEHLLKESIVALREELPSLATFVTLSPIPGFRKWMSVAFLVQHSSEDKGIPVHADVEEGTSPKGGASAAPLLSQKDREALHECGLVSSASPFPWKEFLDTLEEIDFAKLIDDAKSIAGDDMHNDLPGDNDGKEDGSRTSPSAIMAATATPAADRETSRQQQRFLVLRRVLSKLAARYLGRETHRGRPLDRVCRFHAGNGAELHAVRFGADLSRKGLAHGYGLMANYRYRGDDAAAAEGVRCEAPDCAVPLGPGVRRWLEEP